LIVIPKTAVCSKFDWKCWDWESVINQTMQYVVGRLGDLMRTFFNSLVILFPVSWLCVMVALRSWLL
jgi:hypothetical protein